MKKICLLLLIALFNGCAALFPISVADKIHNLKIGMTIEEVVRVMDQWHEVVAATSDIKVLEYRTVGNTASYYRLRFVDDILVGWDKEYRPLYPPHLNQQGLQINTPTIVVH